MLLALLDHAASLCCLVASWIAGTPSLKTVPPSRLLARISRPMPLAAPSRYAGSVRRGPPKFTVPGTSLPRFQLADARHQATGAVPHPNAAAAFASRGRCRPRQFRRPVFQDFLPGIFRQPLHNVAVARNRFPCLQFAHHSSSLSRPALPRGSRSIPTIQALAMTTPVPSGADIFLRTGHHLALRSETSYHWFTCNGGKLVMLDRTCVPLHVGAR